MTNFAVAAGIPRVIWAMFQYLSEVGAGLGAPWGVLFPVFVALFVFLAFFNGFRLLCEGGAFRVFTRQRRALIGLLFSLGVLVSAFAVLAEARQAPYAGIATEVAGGLVVGIALSILPPSAPTRDGDLADDWRQPCGYL
jgi:hypothetical protein